MVFTSYEDTFAYSWAVENGFAMNPIIFNPDLILPKGVKKIESGAFSNCKFSGIQFSESLMLVENYAFEGCNNLKYVIIPNSNTILEEFAFGDNTYLTIYAPKGSEAEIWATTYGYDFVPKVICAE